MSRCTRKSLEQERYNQEFTAAAATKSGVGGTVLSARAGRRASVVVARAFHVAQSQANHMVNTTTQPTNNTVKGGVADEESFFKRSLQSTLTVNALQVHAVRR